MPRGVYDRSKIKAKREIEKAVSPLSAPTKGKKAKQVKQAKGVSAASSATEARVEISSAKNAELYKHLQEMNSLRAGLVGPAGHNDQLLGVVDGEIIETVRTLKGWRESTFPDKSDQKMPAATAPNQGMKAAPAPVQAPIGAAHVPAPAPVAPTPPLPFSPQAVQELQKAQQ
jgi:hypothetical protein